MITAGASTGFTGFQTGVTRLVGLRVGLRVRLVGLLVVTRLVGFFVVTCLVGFFVGFLVVTRLVGFLVGFLVGILVVGLLVGCRVGMGQSLPPPTTKGPILSPT